jgi:hypothetical protein
MTPSYFDKKRKIKKREEEKSPPEPNIVPRYIRTISLGRWCQHAFNTTEEGSV